MPLSDQIRIAISESVSILHYTAPCSMIFIAKHPDAENCRQRGLADPVCTSITVYGIPEFDAMASMRCSVQANSAAHAVSH